MGIAQNRGWSELHWHGDKWTPGYVCAHRDLSATACPGDHLYTRSALAVERANAILKGTKSATPLGWPLQMWTVNVTKAQKFEIIDNDDGTVSFRCVANGLMLDVTGGIAKAGTIVQLWPANGTKAQKWILKSIKVGRSTVYVIQSALDPTLYLDVQWANPENGALLHIWTGDDANLAQHWALLSSDNGKTHHIENPLVGRCIDAVGGGVAA